MKQPMTVATLVDTSMDKEMLAVTDGEPLPMVVVVVAGEPQVLVVIHN
jgi:hypothetical protein